MLQLAEHLLLGFTRVQQSPAKQNANTLHGAWVVGYGQDNPGFKSWQK